MIKIFILVLALGIGLVGPLKAMVETDTHMYLVSKDSGILVIDRQTGAEQLIPFKDAVYMAVHGQFGYVFQSISAYDDDDSTDDSIFRVYVMDLNTNQIIKKNIVDTAKEVIAFYGDRGYLINEHGESLIIIDLKTHQLINTVPLGRNLENIIIHGDKAYLLSGLNSSFVFNLKKNMVEKRLTLSANAGSDDDDSSDGSSSAGGSGDEERDDVNGEMMLIRGYNGYILSNSGHGVFVLDLTTDTVVTKIPVGYHPQSMTFFGDKGYVRDISTKLFILDLLTNSVFKEIPLKSSAQSIDIRGDVGYLKNSHDNTVSILDLRTDTVSKSIDFPNHGTVDFTHTHVYINNIKKRPLYPTKNLIKTFIEKGWLGEFVALMPEEFKLGEINPRLIPRNPTVLDTLPPYMIVQQLKDFMNDGASLLNLLVTLKNPKVAMGVKDVMPEIYATLFQAVWFDKDDKVKEMLTQLVQLKDPVITPLVTYHYKIDAGAEGSFKDALDEAPVKKTKRSYKAKVNDDES